MRRAISVVTVAIAIVALGLVLYNATLVDRRAPSVTTVLLSAPVEGDPAIGHTLTAVNIVFSEPVDHASVERRFRITPHVAGTITWDGTTAIFTPARKLPPDTAFVVSVAPGFVDRAGNIAEAGIEAWTFRTVGPPAVVEVTPADGTANVSVETTVVLRFDRLMDTGAVEAALGVEPAVPVRSAWSGEELTLHFDRALLFGTTYTIAIGIGAADTDGSRLRAPFVAQFTTVAAGLRAEATVPAAGVAGISVRSPIAIVFDGPIDPSSIEGALRLTPSVDGSIRVADLPSDAQPRGDSPSVLEGFQRLLLFTPSAPLAPHTTYTVTLDPVVRRADGDEVAEGRTWSFTTGQRTLSGQNQIGFLSARGGIRNVWIMNPDGSNPRQLTTELSPVSGFDVTGDGSTLVWSAGGVVRTMAIDGGDERTLTMPDRYEYAPKLTPDGRAVLVGRRSAAGIDLGYWLVPMPGILDRDERQILSDGAPPLGSVLLAGDGIGATDGTPTWMSRAAFDPTEERLLVATAGGGVRLVDLATDAAVAPISDTGLIASAGPVWLATENRFVIIAEAAPGSGPSLWTVEPSGALGRHVSAHGSVAVSAGGLVAFLVRDDAGTAHVAVHRLVSNEAPRQLTNGGDASDRWPALSPGGETVVFARINPGGGDRTSGIWTVHSSTRRLVQLSPDGAYPRWLP